MELRRLNVCSRAASTSISQFIIAILYAITLFIILMFLLVVHEMLTIKIIIILALFARAQLVTKTIPPTSTTTSKSFAGQHCLLAAAHQPNEHARVSLV